MKYKLNYIVDQSYLDIHGIELCSQTNSEMIIVKSDLYDTFSIVEI